MYLDALSLCEGYLPRAESLKRGDRNVFHAWGRVEDKQGLPQEVRSWDCIGSRTDTLHS